jgi:hypothetical protein
MRGLVKLKDHDQCRQERKTAKGSHEGSPITNNDPNFLDRLGGREQGDQPIS